MHGFGKRTFRKHTACMISGFHCYVDEISALLGYYTASSGNCLPTFQVNLLVPFSTSKKLSS
jgi:hypothetical protein